MNSIVLCRDCINWKPSSSFPDCPRTLPATQGYWEGKCSRIRDAIDIEVKAGWDGGYVDYVETDANFGCVLGVLKT